MTEFKCPKCQTKLIPGATVCPVCRATVGRGAATAGTAPQAVQVRPARVQSRPAGARPDAFRRLGSVIAIAVALLVGVARLVGHRSTSRSSYNTNTATTGSGGAQQPQVPLSATEDKKHRLFQAAAATRDDATARRVNEKIGVSGPDGRNTAYAQRFYRDHLAWAQRDSAFFKLITTPADAREYVNQHIDDDDLRP